MHLLTRRERKEVCLHSRCFYREKEKKVLSLKKTAAFLSSPDTVAATNASGLNPHLKLYYKRCRPRRPPTPVRVCADRVHHSYCGTEDSSARFESGSPTQGDDAPRDNTHHMHRNACPTQPTADEIIITSHQTESVAPFR